MCVYMHVYIRIYTCIYTYIYMNPVGSVKFIIFFLYLQIYIFLLHLLHICLYVTVMLKDIL